MILNPVETIEGEDLVEGRRRSERRSLLDPRTGDVHRVVLEGPLDGVGVVGVPHHVGKDVDAHETGDPRRRKSRQQLLSREASGSAADVQDVDTVLQGGPAQGRDELVQIGSTVLAQLLADLVVQSRVVHGL